MWASGSKVAASNGGGAPFESRCRVKLDGDQTVAPAGWVPIEFELADYDVLGELDAANYRVEVAADGLYEIRYNLTVQQVDAGFEGQVRVVVSGGIVAGCCEFVGCGTFADNKANGAFIQEMTAGQHVFLELYHSNAASRLVYATSSGGSVLCVRRVA